MCTRPWAHPEINIWGLGSSWRKESLRLLPPYLELGWSQSSPEVHERMICPLWLLEAALSMGLNWSWISILTSVNIVSYSEGFKAALCTIQTRLSTRCLPPIGQMLFMKYLRNKYWSKHPLHLIFYHSGRPLLTLMYTCNYLSDWRVSIALTLGHHTMIKCTEATSCWLGQPENHCGIRLTVISPTKQCLCRSSYSPQSPR